MNILPNEHEWTGNDYLQAIKFTRDRDWIVWYSRLTPEQNDNLNNLLYSLPEIQRQAVIDRVDARVFGSLPESGHA